MSWNQFSRFFIILALSTRTLAFLIGRTSVKRDCFSFIGLFCIFHEVLHEVLFEPFLFLLRCELHVFAKFIFHFASFKLIKEVFKIEVDIK